MGLVREIPLWEMKWRGVKNYPTAHALVPTTGDTDDVCSHWEVCTGKSEIMLHVTNSESVRREHSSLS